MSIELALLPIAIAAIAAVANRKKPNKTSERAFYIETRMNDPRLLQLALQNCGCSSIVTGQAVNTATQAAQITFEPVEDSGFRAVFAGEISSNQADEFLANVFTEYTRTVQEETYQKLKQRAAAKGMILETEQLQDDDSIVLTFTLQQR